ncbi:MAG: hypothetical protein WBA62_19135 [Xanthobacteraceae bacterium]
MSKLAYDKDLRTRGIHRRLMDYAIAKAAKGDATILEKYLRFGIPITEHEHLNALADLIVPKAKQVGRPKGPDPSPRAEAVRTLVDMVQRLERDWRSKNPDEPFRNVRRSLINQVFALPCDDGTFGFPNPITEDEIFIALNRKGSSQKKSN